MLADSVQNRAYSPDGSVVELHSRVGEGGEGVVYHVGGRSDLVAKIYHPFDSDAERLEREKKLRAISRLDNERLREAGAWPQSVLLDGEGQFCGYVMQYLGGYMPLHMAYQTKSRLKRLPGKNFDFLVRIARNLSACVHFVHEAGLVIGDFNESNVLVTAGAMVRMIDVDSYQVTVDGETLTPKVGKMELMPPELQGVDLDGVPRKPEEDLFTLAVLIFQTLMFGRHPFAGRPRNSDQEITPEMAIEHGWYAYSERRESPLAPPRGVNLDFLSPGLRAMFEDAFSLDRNRPTAEKWHEELTRFEQSLSTCTASPTHIFWAQQEVCPWCEMETMMRAPVFSPAPPKSNTSDDLDAKELISTLKRPETHGLLNSPPTPEISREKESLVRSLKSWTLKNRHFSFVALFGIYALVRELISGSAHASLWVVAALLSFAFFVLPLVNSIRYWSLKRTVAPLEARYLRFVDQWNRSASADLVDKKLDELNLMADEYHEKSRLAEELRLRYLKIEYGDQLTRFLRKYSLAIADVDSEDRAFLEQLMNGGVKTAADVSEESLARIISRKSAIFDRLLEWVEGLEASFWTTSSFALDITKEREIVDLVARERAGMRNRIEAAVKEYRSLGTQLELNQATLLREYERFGDEYARRLQQFGETVDHRAPQRLNA